MTGANASGVTRYDNESVAAVARWLRLAAAPTFTIMALLAVVFDGGAPSGLCAATGNLWPGGMATMYLLMGVFHSVPWLSLISQRRNIGQRS
jgi:hypothetical protein